MRIIAYPAVLSNCDNQPGVYTVTFPDIPGAISEGHSVGEAIQNGSEALGLALYDQIKLPKPSDMKLVEKDNPDAIVTLISSDLNYIAKTVKKPTVKKNTTIPRDLARKAEAVGINFSKALTDALKEKLQERL